LNKEKPAKRTYNSSRRKEQARLTNRQIVEAARKLFIERGYSGATIEAIAQEAGVSVETVYATFGSKRAILTGLIDVSLVGDDEPVPLLQRPGPQAVQQEKNQQHQIQLFARDMTEIMGRMAPLFGIMRVAAKTEPEISEVLQNILESRVHGMEAFIRYLAANGPLRDNLSQAEAGLQPFNHGTGLVRRSIRTVAGENADKVVVEIKKHYPPRARELRGHRPLT
jgi:TetR/AcrR family transcriptional regulator of autoinduction and epiphytic fitness